MAVFSSPPLLPLSFSIIVGFAKELRRFCFLLAACACLFSLHCALHAASRTTTDNTADQQKHGNALRSAAASFILSRVVCVDTELDYHMKPIPLTACSSPPLLLRHACLTTLRCWRRHWPRSSLLFAARSFAPLLTRSIARLRGVPVGNEGGEDDVRGDEGDERRDGPVPEGLLVAPLQVLGAVKELQRLWLCFIPIKRPTGKSKSPTQQIYRERERTREIHPSAAIKRKIGRQGQRTDGQLDRWTVGQMDRWCTLD